MALVKAHIVFEEDKVEKPEGRSKMLEKLKKIAQITGVNQKRFDQYGILTGMIDEDELEKVRKIPGVTSVEVDAEKYLQ
jgi:N-acetylneuraminic acid mutarotase